MTLTNRIFEKDYIMLMLYKDKLYLDLTYILFYSIQIVS